MRSHVTQRSRFWPFVLGGLFTAGLIGLLAAHRSHVRSWDDWDAW